MGDGSLWSTFDSMLNDSVAIIVDNVNGAGKPQHVNKRRHRHQDGVKRTAGVADDRQAGHSTDATDHEDHDGQLETTEAEQ